MDKKYVLLSFVGILLFLPYLGSVHLFDWDEANFAELAREMIVSGDYLQPQINFLPFYEKPPMFIWFQVLSMKIFGVNEFAARFPNVICGIFVLCSLFHIGRKHFSEQFGWLWALSFGASIAPNFYFRTGLIDPFFNYFIFLAIYFFAFLLVREGRDSLRYCVLSSLFTSLAIMTKGPVALILIAGSLGLGWIFIKFQNIRKIGWSFLWIIVSIGLSTIWFYYITKNYGDTYVHEFIDYQIRLFETEDAKHGGTILFHPIALLLGCFPASIFMWSAFCKELKVEKTDFQKIMFKMMMACGIVVLVVFSLVKTKIIHYSSMDYYPITFFAAFGLDQLILKNKKPKFWQIIALGSIGFIWFCALILAPFAGNNLEKIIPYIGDKNFLEQLKTPLVWHDSVGVFGLIFGIIYAYSLYFFANSKVKKAIIAISIGCVLCIQVIAIYYLPRIEKLVQGSLVEFCKSLKGKDVNTQALYVKSYNQYFYSDRQPYINKEDSLKHLYYLYYPLEKDCYFILRTIDKISMDTSRSPNSNFLYSKNGFVFYKRGAN